MISRTTPNDAYEPTPNDIRRACDAIQRRWSPELRNKRAVASGGAWLPPEVKWSDVGASVQNSGLPDQ